MTTTAAAKRKRKPKPGTPAAREGFRVVWFDATTEREREVFISKDRFAAYEGDQINIDPRSYIITATPTTEQAFCRGGGRCTIRQKQKANGTINHTRP